MALPTNRIKKIKLLDNTEYEIVPERLGKNNLEVKLPYFYEDSHFLIESNPISIPVSGGTSDEYYFGEIVPDEIAGPWIAEFYFSFTLSTHIAGSNTIFTPEGKVTLMCNYGTLSSSNSAANNISYKTELTQGPWQTGGSITVVNNLIFRSLRSDYATEAWGSDYGNLLAFNGTLQYVTKINIKLIRMEGCRISLFEDGAIRGYTNTPIYQDNPNYIYQYTSTVDLNNNGLWSSSIASANTNVGVYNSYSGGTFYFTGANSTGTTSLYRDSSKYFRNGNTYLYGGTTYVNNLGVNGTYYYNDGISYYDENDDDSYYLNFPSKAGTIALTSDITTVPIEDLTNINN